MSYKFRAVLLLDREVMASFVKVAAMPMPYKKAFDFFQIMNEIGTHMKDYEEDKESILIDNCKKNNKGEPMVDKKGQYKFKDIKKVEGEVFKLYDTEITISRSPFTADDLEYIAPNMIEDFAKASALLGSVKN